MRGHDGIIVLFTPLTLWIWIPLRRGVLDTTLCNKVSQWLATGQWFSPGTTGKRNLVVTMQGARKK